MGEKLVVGPFNRGFRTDREPFAIDNDNFPMLVNAYQWRGRIKRKRGTTFLGRLNRYISVSVTLSSGTVNLITSLSLQTNSTIVMGSINLFGGTDGTTYTDPNQNGTLKATGGTGTGGTINYSSGVITITGGANETLTGNIKYYPNLPVMGLEDLILETQDFATNLGFDTTYSYNLSGTIPSIIYDVSFYKNPANNTYTGYVRKGNLSPFWTPVTWNGLNYQQVYTVNYQGALWATYGIRFTNNKPDLTAIGMQFAPSSTIIFDSNTPTTITLTITNCPLVIGDFVFLNEWGATTSANAQTLNYQSGFVTASSPNTIPLATKTVTITLPNANLASDTFVPGIVQYLTTTVSSTLDCLRWYDGDPTNGVNFIPSTSNGWVNFSPPLSQFVYSIDELPARQYYLVSARMIIPFKDRLLFLGPVVQASTGTPFYLQDTVIYSQNGTAYYTASFQGNPVAATTIFTAILVPTNQTATAPAYFEDQVGFGGFISAGIDQKLNTIAPNEDSLIAGFDTQQTQIVYTGNDVSPFLFYRINSELGSSSTFSTVIMDEGVLTRGTRGFAFTNRTNAKRFDEDILDQNFEISLLNNGTERITAQRDFINEWIYFTYSPKGNPYVYPTQTLQYNYRDDSWAVFNESYTTYGTFRPNSGYTWASIGQVYSSWNAWNDPWTAGVSNIFQPIIIGGNQQGFILMRGQGTSEASSLYIQNISGNTVTSPNHCLLQNDYITISGVLGTQASLLNGLVFSVGSVIDSNTFSLNPAVNITAYIGGGSITRIYKPFIQTRQFPTSWEMGRKTRIGVQQYLLTQADTQSQITLLIYLSQNQTNPFNDLTAVVNSGLIYSTVLYTCAESTNIGLTPANTNLLELTEVQSGNNQQNQIWHRINTSLIGDTVQLGFTMSDAQMRALNANGNFISQFSEIEIHGFILDLNPSQVLS
jgi:hypothetical protein